MACPEASLLLRLQHFYGDAVNSFNFSAPQSSRWKLVLSVQRKLHGRDVDQLCYHLPACYVLIKKFVATCCPKESWSKVYGPVAYTRVRGVLSSLKIDLGQLASKTCCCTLNLIKSKLFIFHNPYALRWFSLLALHFFLL